MPAPEVFQERTDYGGPVDGTEGLGQFHSLDGIGRGVANDCNGLLDCLVVPAQHFYKQWVLSRFFRQAIHLLGQPFWQGWNARSLKGQLQTGQEKFGRSLVRGRPQQVGATVEVFLTSCHGVPAHQPLGNGFPEDRLFPCVALAVPVLKNLPACLGVNLDAPPNHEGKTTVRGAFVAFGKGLQNA